MNVPGFSWDPQTWKSHEDVLDGALAAAQSGSGFSFCRFGDGETFILGRHLQIVPPMNAQLPGVPRTLALYQTHQLWPPGLSDGPAPIAEIADSLGIAAELLRCLREASMVGLWWHEQGPGMLYQRALLEEVIKHACPELFESPDRMTHCAAPYLFPYSARFVELLRLGRVCAVGDTSEYLRTVLRDQLAVDVMPVPLGRAWGLEAAWEQITATQAEWSVCLLSCGTSAKILALRIHQRLSKVGLDIGWLGNALAEGIMAANDPKGFRQAHLPGFPGNGQ